MKQANIINNILAGKFLLVGKFVHFKKEVVAYRDRQTGQAATFNKLEFTILTANGIVFVQPDTRKIPGFKMDAYVCPFKDNQQVVIEVEKMVTERGTTTVAGNIEVLEA